MCIPVEENELFDFRGFRLDWFRLQAYTSVAKAGLVLRDHQGLAKHMNTVVFHTKMVDYLDEMINETGDLSVYWSVEISDNNVRPSVSNTQQKCLYGGFVRFGTIFFFYWLPANCTA